MTSPTIIEGVRKMVQQERRSRHLGLKVLVLLCALMVFAVPAMAARGGSGGGGGGGGGKHGGGGTTSGSGSLTLVMVSDANGDGLPNQGDTITFNVSTTATDQPWVNLQCFQNGTLVAQGWNGFFDGSITGRNFGLYSGVWSSGAADCTAYLDNPQWSVLASTSFHAGA
jgi:hypothetical protein